MPSLDEYIALYKPLGDYQMVTNPDELQQLTSMAIASPRCGFDYETQPKQSVGPSGAPGFDFDPYTGEIVGYSFAVKPKQAWYVPMRHIVGENCPLEPTMVQLKRMLTEANLIPYNALYEYKWSRVHVPGITDMELILDEKAQAQPGKDPTKFRLLRDSCISAFLDNPNRAGRAMREFGISMKLKDVIFELFGIKGLKFEEVLAVFGVSRFSEVPSHHGMWYGCADSDFALRVDDKLTPAVMANLAPIFRLEHQLIPVIADMELEGVCLNAPLLDEGAVILELAIEGMKLEFFELANQPVQKDVDGKYLWPIDLNSPAQASELLFDRLRIPHPTGMRGKNGYLPIGKKDCGDIKDKYEVVAKYFEYKEAFTMMNNFLEKLPTYVNPVTGRVHGSINQTGAPTGRFSHSNPNQAQVPKKRD